MDISSLSPYIRYANIFSYFPNCDDFVAGFDYRIFYINDGSIFLNFEDCRFLLSKHTIALIPPGTFYKLVPVDSKSTEIICMNFDTIKGEGRPVTSVHPVVKKEFNSIEIFEKELIDVFSSFIILNDSGALKDKLSEILREFVNKEFGYDIKSSGILSSILISLARNSNKNSVKKEARLVSEIRKYLHDNMSEQLDASEIGERFHYHPNYLNRVFKQNIGVTLHNYIVSIRIKLAKELLVTSNLSLEKIALRCGYKTLSHFSQSFKKNCGLSPKDYRNSAERITL